MPLERRTYTRISPDYNIKDYFICKLWTVRSELLCLMVELSLDAGQPFCQTDNFLSFSSVRAEPGMCFPRGCDFWSGLRLGLLSGNTACSTLYTPKATWQQLAHAVNNKAETCLHSFILVNVSIWPFSFKPAHTILSCLFKRGICISYISWRQCFNTVQIYSNYIHYWSALSLSPQPGVADSCPSLSPVLPENSFY